MFKLKCHAEDITGGGRFGCLHCTTMVGTTTLVLFGGAKVQNQRLKGKG